MRKFLYSRGFFGFLALVLAFDLSVDVLQHFFLEERPILDAVEMLLDAISMALTLWMFIDLSQRRPRRGGNPSG